MKELNYQIVRSPKRKTLTITVERDRTVMVHVPEGAPEDDVHRVVDEKRQWILAKRRHPQKYKERVPPGKEVVNGESAPYLGRDYRIEVADTEKGWIHCSQYDAASHPHGQDQWYVVSRSHQRRPLPRPLHPRSKAGCGYDAPS